MDIVRSCRAHSPLFLVILHPVRSMANLQLGLPDWNHIALILCKNRKKFICRSRKSNTNFDNKRWWKLTSTCTRLIRTIFHSDFARRTRRRSLSNSTKYVFVFMRRRYKRSSCFMRPTCLQHWHQTCQNMCLFFYGKTTSKNAIIIMNCMPTHIYHLSSFNDIGSNIKRRSWKCMQLNCSSGSAKAILLGPRQATATII